MNRIKLVALAAFAVAGLASFVISSVLLLTSDKFSYQRKGVPAPTHEGGILIIFGLLGGLVTLGISAYKIVRNR